MPNRFLTTKEAADSFMEIIWRVAVESLPADATEDDILKLQAKIMYHMQGPLGGFPPEENK